MPAIFSPIRHSKTSWMGSYRSVPPNVSFSTSVVLSTKVLSVSFTAVVLVFTHPKTSWFMSLFMFVMAPLVLLIIGAATGDGASLPLALERVVDTLVGAAVGTIAALAVRLRAD